MLLFVVLVFMFQMIGRAVSLSLSSKSLFNIHRSISGRQRLKSLNMQTYSSSETLRISTEMGEFELFRGDLLVIPFYKPQLLKTEKDDTLELVNALIEMIPSTISANIKETISVILAEENFKADAASKYVFRIVASEHSTPLVNNVKYVALVGLGPSPSKETNRDIEVTTAVRLGRTIASVAKDINAESIGIVLFPGTKSAGITQLLLGVHDAFYVDNRYKKVPPGGFKSPKLKSLKFLGCSDPSLAGDIALTNSMTTMIASGVHFAKDLVGAPSNSKTPVVIADLARKMAAEHNMEVKVLGAEECESLNMGGYLGVQQGSKFPPQFIHMTYKPKKPAANVVKVALIGKGLTFDSGGYNLKAGPGSMIELMKFDMGGCAAVLGCAKAISQLKPNNVEVHFISAVCENMISAEAMRPGDILTASNGKTIEVLNTDAEGRLTLSDALVYAEKLQVDTIIDLATLTGACIVALGEKMAGLYSSDSSLRDEIESAAKRTDEGIWSLPLEQQYKENIKSSIADIKNLGAKGGGSITAALFLQEFVEKTSWAHIDMAGPVWDTGANKPTGYGVKLLVDYLLNAKKKK